MKKQSKAKRIIDKYLSSPWTYKTEAEILSDIEKRILLGYIASHYFSISEMPLVYDMEKYCEAFIVYYIRFGDDVFYNSDYANAFSPAAYLAETGVLSGERIEYTVKKIYKRIKNLVNRLDENDFNELYSIVANLAINPDYTES